MDSSDSQDRSDGVDAQDRLVLARRRIAKLSSAVSRLSEDIERINDEAAAMARGGKFGEELQKLQRDIDAGGIEREAALLKMMNDKDDDV